jgi:hypothetical protein
MAPSRLLTTTRLVFAYSNRLINDNYLKIALKPLPGGQYLTLGESVQQAKNLHMQATSAMCSTTANSPCSAIRPCGWVFLNCACIDTLSITSRSRVQIHCALQKYTFSRHVTDAPAIL